MNQTKGNGEGEVREGGRGGVKQWDGGREEVGTGGVEVRGQIVLIFDVWLIS